MTELRLEKSDKAKGREREREITITNIEGEIFFLEQQKRLFLSVSSGVILRESCF